MPNSLLSTASMWCAGSSFADGFIQRGQQALTRGQSVYGDVLHAVRDPDIHYRWRAKLLAKISRDAAAGFDMVDPELADFIVGMRKGKPVRAQRVREAGRVKIQTQPVGFRPRHPVRKVFRFDFVTRDRLIGFEINGVQVQALWPGIRLSASSRSARSSVALRALP